MTTIEIDYHTYMKRLQEIELSYLKSDIPPHWREKGLRMAMTYRHHIEQDGSDNFRYFLNTANGMVGYVEKCKCEGYKSEGE